MLCVIEPAFMNILCYAFSIVGFSIYISPKITHTHANTYTYTHTHTHTCTHTHIHMHTHTHTNIHTHIYEIGKKRGNWDLGQNKDDNIP